MIDLSRMCKCGHPEYLHSDEGCYGDMCPCPGFQFDELVVATAQDIADLRAMLPYLNGPVGHSICVVGEDGIRYTFCNKGIAQGAESQEMTLSFVSTLHNIGAKRSLRHGFLWPLEEMIYYAERRRIINEIIGNLSRGPVNPRLKIHPQYDVTPYPEDFGLEADVDFIEDWRKAIERTNKKHHPPKVQASTKLAIKQLHGIWWLLHQQWMPLCFDSFEEAVVFAKRYIRSEHGK